MKQIKNTDIKTKKRTFSLFRLFRIKSVSIYQIALFMLVTTAVISGVLVSGLWAYTESIRVNNQIKKLNENALINQENLLKDEVEKLINHLENRAIDTIHHTVAQIQYEALKYFESMRFGNDGYVFVNTYSGYALLFDGQLIVEPKDISNLTDPGGQNLFETELALAKQTGGGSFQYQFKKIYNSTPQPKISYIMGFDQYEWIIGVGDYLDNIEKETSRLKNNLKSNLNSLFLLMFLVLISLVILLIFTTSRIARTIQNQFDEFVLLVKNHSLNENKKLPFERIYIHELKVIAQDLIKANELASQFDLLEQKVQEKTADVNASRLRYLNLFENAPVSIWEEDYSEVIRFLNEQMTQKQLPIEELFEQYPELIKDCAAKAIILDFNQNTLTLYGAKSKEELMGSLDKVFIDKSLGVFKKSLIALFSNQSSFTSEAVDISLDGKKLELLIKWTFNNLEGKPGEKVILSKVDLSYLKKAERELRESEARFRAIFENNHTVMLLIDPETHRFIDVNPSAIEYYGYTREQFLNELTIDEINMLSPVEIKATIEESKAKQNAFFNFKHRLSNGEIRDVEVHTGLIHYKNKQVLFTIVIDITEKKQIEDALLKAMNKTESIFRSAPVGIGVVSNRVFTEVNKRLCDMLGFSADELIGKESKIVYPSLEEFNRVGKEKYEQIKEKGTGSVETVFKRKDGKLINVILSSTPLDINNLEEGVTFSALDITERVNDLKELEKYRLHLEETVNERTRELSGSQDALLNLVDDLSLQSSKLEKANSRLAEINEELETFTYSVSHDLKAPLRGIDGYSQLLLEDFQNELSEEANLFLLNIRKSTEQMALLIEDLLAYSRMERKDFIAEKIKFKGLIDDMILYFSKQIEKQKLKIIYSFPDNFMLAADKDGLNLILRNFVDNAIKFTVQSENPQIEIGGTETKEKWLIFVKDNGIGFDMKYHDRIFKIFQRLHLSEEFEGTGIGLAMVGKAAQRMKGKIWAESELGKGATFYLEIGK